MKLSVAFMAALWIHASCAMLLEGETDPPADDAVQAAVDQLVRTALDGDGSATAKARKALVSLGPSTVPGLAAAARGHGDARVRYACYRLLLDSFAGDERAIDAVLRHALQDQDPGIRRECASLLGDLRIRRAEPALWAALETATAKDDRLSRYALSKSLAQLGQADVLRNLFAAVSDDSIDARQFGNVGLKALSGKNLEDFEGYDHKEGAVEISGFRVTQPIDPVASAEKKARRFQAATAYFRWLRAERPDLYERFSTAYQRRRQFERLSRLAGPRDDGSAAAASSQ